MQPVSGQVAADNLELHSVAGFVSDGSVKMTSVLATSTLWFQFCSQTQYSKFSSVFPFVQQRISVIQILLYIMSPSLFTVVGTFTYFIINPWDRGQELIPFGRIFLGFRLVTKVMEPGNSQVHNFFPSKRHLFFSNTLFVLTSVFLCCISSVVCFSNLVIFSVSPVVFCVNLVVSDLFLSLNTPSRNIQIFSILNVFTSVEYNIVLYIGIVRTCYF